MKPKAKLLSRSLLVLMLADGLEIIVSGWVGRSSSTSPRALLRNILRQILAPRPYAT